MYLSSFIAQRQEVIQNWSSYRCRPDIMLTAPIYGQNITDNFQFCLKHGFDQRASSAISPFYTYLGSFATILVTFMNSINSIRMTFATIIGSVTQVFTEFSQRLQVLFYRFEMSAMRIKFLMSRLFATMHSILFMGMSGIRATQNFGNTFLFKFLNVFCFDPATQLDIVGKGRIAMVDVKVGDLVVGSDEKVGAAVTATFRFAGDGHEMVSIDGIHVSRKHGIFYKNAWIEAGDHPAALPAGVWSGELVCLNTTTHTIPIGGHMFRDYEETDDYVEEVGNLTMAMLNGHKPHSGQEPRSGQEPHSGQEPRSGQEQGKGQQQQGHQPHSGQKQNAVHAYSPTTRIILADGSSAPAHTLSIGSKLSHGTVIGTSKYVVTEACDISGELYTPNTTVWCASTSRWDYASVVAGGLIRTIKPTIFLSCIVSPSAVIESANGLLIRDSMEIHDPAIHWFSRMKEEAAVSVL
jgi:hypothetical protein